MQLHMIINALNHCKVFKYKMHFFHLNKHKITEDAHYTWVYNFQLHKLQRIIRALSIHPFMCRQNTHTIQASHCKKII